MNTKTQSRWLILLLVLIPTLASAGKPTWARKATGFAGDCKSGCHPVRVVAPDKKSAVDVLYSDDGTPHLRVTGADKEAREVRDLGVGPWNDLLWAPDSKGFFVDAGEGMTSPAFVQVYLLDDPQLRPVEVTREAEADMVKSFPPCKALYLDAASCRKMERNPGYNITAIDWKDDSSGIVLMIQVPCTSEYGGIMCQVMGYEVDVPSGNVVQRMQAAEFRKEWQKSMAQRMQVPEAAQYQ
ncbi:MAG: hypothetical protein WA655_17305 [Candidatus Korobacteraceae bacterium]